jgi:hypothetical protein
MSKQSAVQAKRGSAPGLTSCSTHRLERRPTLGLHSCVQREAVRPVAHPAVPPLVRDVVNSPGQPLDAAAHSFMKSRFGCDFSDVRVHTDAKAAESASSVTASAYTVGPNLVFAAGKYAPSDDEGRKLIAHELTHVLQQRGFKSASPLKLGDQSGAAELEAIKLSEQALTGPSMTANDLSSVPSNLIQRSVGGGLLGGVLGGAGGALAGGIIAGPVGAIVGGIAGFVGGGLLGEQVSTRRRKLTTREISDAREIFQNSVEYGEIEITRDSLYAVGAPRTIGNTIHLKSDWGHFLGSTLELTDQGRETLIHELTHVWQYQNGGLAYIPQSIIAQIRAAIGSGSRGAAYDWRQAHRAGQAWNTWNPEQQAEMVENYNTALQRIRSGRGAGEDYQTVSMALPYLEAIRRREGAPTFGIGAPTQDSGLLQRKCRCGGMAGPSGECEECRKKRQAPQMETPEAEFGPRDAIFAGQASRDVVRSSGEPLDPATRTFMESGFSHELSNKRIPSEALAPQNGMLMVAPACSKFEQDADDAADRVIRRGVTQVKREIAGDRGSGGADFSAVRVHTDPLAARSAQNVNALAYTLGRHIVFNTGRYAPSSNEGRRLLAHELTHVLQQTQRFPIQEAYHPARIHRKVILKGAEMSAKDRTSFLRARKWTAPALAHSVMEDMAAAADPFDFADESELQLEIVKRLSTVGHMKESQETVEKIPGDKRSAFGYPFTGASILYGPRVNYAARSFWEPPVPDSYATRTDRIKNKELLNKPRSERCTVYGDPCYDYGWKLSAAGKADPYNAIKNLFLPQPPKRRTLIHCDYLISLVNLMSIADAVGPSEFKKRIEAFGTDKVFLKWNAFTDLHVWTFERTATGEFKKTAAGGAIPLKGLASTQSVQPTTEADLVIGDHVVFFNHLAYDLINERIGNAWRLENAVLVGKDSGGRDIFLGHGSGYKTANQMRAKLAEEYNAVAKKALDLIAQSKSPNKKTLAAAVIDLSTKFPSVKQVDSDWRIQGVPRLIGNLGCPRTIDEKLRPIKSEDVLGPKSPCEPTKMNKVERPIESAK